MKRILQRLSAATVALVAVALLMTGILWPRGVAEILHSRLTVLLIVIWCGGFALLLHPRLSAGLLLGIGEFRKAMDDVVREIRGDDDDGPRAV